MFDLSKSERSVYLVYVYDGDLEMVERVETNYKRAKEFARNYSIQHDFKKVIVSRYFLDKHENWDIYDSLYDDYLEDIKEFNKKKEEEIKEFNEKIEKEKQRMEIEKEKRRIKWGI